MLMIAPQGCIPPQGIEVGEKLQLKYDKTRVFFAGNLLKGTG